MWTTKINSFLESRTRSVASWIIAAFLVLYVDYVTGPSIKFPLLVILPIALAAWYNDRSFSIFLSIICAAASGLLIPYLWFREFDPIETGINAAIQLSVFVLIAYLIDRISRMTKEIKTLEGFLPICSFCKKIRDKNDTWHQMEEYITDHSEAQFSHGVCPDCAQKHYGFTVKT